MKILVTGGGGYLGSVLSGFLLQKGHRVRILDNFMYGVQSVWGIAGDENLEIVRGDLRSATVLSEGVKDMDAVVHLAAIVGDPACRDNPEMARAVNLHASLDLIRAAEDVGVQKFIFASTCSNYGCIAENAASATENSPLQPLSLYAENKVAVERHLLEEERQGMSRTVLRFATLYGLSPRMRFDLTVNEFVMSLFTENALTVFGKQFWRPYVHVRDAARAVVTVLNASSEQVCGEVFNVGDSAENYRKMDLVEILLRRLPMAQVEFVHRAEDPRDYRVSFERIKHRLGYSISRTVPDGVDEVLAALRVGLIEHPRAAFHNNTSPLLSTHAQR